MTKKRKKLSSKTFQRQVLLFSGATVLVLGAIVYFSFSNTVITITPRTLDDEVEVSIRVHAAQAEEAPAAEEAPSTLPTLQGRILSTEATGEATGSGSENAVEEDARAGGTVVLHNGWSQAQPLQAGTRLLSKDGILFRTVERVDIPSGGSVKAEVLADEPGKAGEVAPGRFEIVALWPGLKEVIYGESTEAFTGGTKIVTTIEQTDLNAARSAAVDAMEKEGRAALDATILEERLTGTLIATRTTVATENTNASVGDERESFSYTVKGTVLGIVVDDELLNEALTTAAIAAIGEHQQLVALDHTSVTATITAVGADTNEATLKVTAGIRATLRGTSPIFDASAIVGKNRQDIITHFDQFPEIVRTEVRFSPFWVFRAPALLDHIDIKLAEAETSEPQ